MGKLISLVGKTKPKVALRKAEARKAKKPADPFQLSLFEQNQEAKVVQLKRERGFFDDALMHDLKNDKKAKELYWEAISQGEQVEDALCNLGILEYNTGNEAKAIDYFTQSLKKDARHFESHYNLANIYLDVEQLKLARIHYEIASEIKPEFPNTFYNLGVVHMMQGAYEEAKKSLEHYLELTDPAEQSEARELILSINQTLEKNRSF